MSPIPAPTAPASGAKVVDHVRIRGYLAAPVASFGGASKAASLRIVAGGVEYGVTVTDATARHALGMQPGDYIVAEGTFFSWPGKALDELWGSISTPLDAEAP